MDDPNRAGPINDSLQGHQDEDMIYESYDDEREQEGVHNCFIAEGARQPTARHDLICEVEQLELDALDWLKFTDDEDAQTVYDMIVELVELREKPTPECELPAVLSPYEDGLGNLTRSCGGPFIRPQHPDETQHQAGLV